MIPARGPQTSVCLHLLVAAVLGKSRRVGGLGTPAEIPYTYDKSEMSGWLSQGLAGFSQCPTDMFTTQEILFSTGYCQLG